MRFGNSSNHVRKKRFIIKMPDIKLLAIFAIACMLSIVSTILEGYRAGDTDNREGRYIHIG